MRIRSIFVSVATVGLMVGPAFAHGVLSSVAGAKAECTIIGTAADDGLNGTTRADVICSKAGRDDVQALEGNDVVRLGQGDDQGEGDDGSDTLCHQFSHLTISRRCEIGMKASGQTGYARDRPVATHRARHRPAGAGAGTVPARPPRTRRAPAPGGRAPNAGGVFAWAGQ